MTAAGQYLLGLSGPLLALLMAVGPVLAGEASISRGGRLYDNWYRELEVAPPVRPHPAYPATGALIAKPENTWLCSTCHGWDYRGRNGAFAAGKHHTGIVGIDAAAGRSPAEIVALLTGPGHHFGGRLAPQDLLDLAAFVSRGQVDVDAFVDRISARARGDGEHYRAHYQAICVNCHGRNGQAQEAVRALGDSARDNPWQALHKMLNGHPGEEMPPLRVLDPAVAAGVLAHVQTLPGIDLAAALSRGGRLYDNWALEIGDSLPGLPRQPYAAERGYAEGVETKWRCVECHGWDYGGHGGIKGIGAMAGAEVEAIVAIVADRDHGYGQLLGERDQVDLARFVSQGQIDMARFIDRESGKARGEAGPYAVYYRTICARCHGSEGMKIRTMPTLGEVAVQNPWETLHKILNGHAAEDMPSLRSLAEPIVAGILAYTQSLPRGGLASSLGRGGRLYDNWPKETKVPVPDRSHPSYPGEARYANKPSSNWRCKECHGWDYLGSDGAYARGRHRTGIKGIAGAAGSEPERIMALLQDKTHGFGSLLDDSDFRDLANFVSRGQIDMDTYIERKSKKAKADGTRFKGYYVTICAGCHGTDGAKNLTMPPLGRTARVNPWEVLHKILNGPPGDSQYHSENADENMPGLRILDMDIVVGIIAYLQTLPADVVVHSY